MSPARTAASDPTPVRGRGRRLARGAGVLVAMALLGAPLVPLLLWALTDRWAYPGLLPDAWGWSGWADAFAQGAGGAALRSLLIGLVVAAVATPLGTAAGRALVMHRPRRAGLVAAVLLAPVAVPPFAVVMGLNVVALRVGAPAEIALVLVLVVAALPYTTFVMRTAYAAYDAGYEDEARTLGASSRAVLLRVHLPLVAPAVAAAAFLAFLVGWSDYIVTLIVGGGDLVTLPMLVGSLAAGSGNQAAVAAASLAAVGPPLALLVIIARATRRATA